ncbi:MAG TPA: tetraacyldisaccharide 4'-kinase [Methylotenera sp.]|nr:tetraacyldisaccharide 4'-kinase [Methylotenera sp.]HPH05739.1 tetraacyldisaccharide 4'-kinase [Methylotenera sp.]HPN01110.1 tetraacyldisaccharide 4'-kinase [Methylotenera sp.]
MANWLQKQWESLTLWHILLVPVSWLFGAVVWLRKSLYQLGWLESYRLSAPVIVVGNITVGGTGKTPLVIWLAEQLKQQGYRPGIICRGYGGTVNQVLEVFSHSNSSEVGDEPVLIAKRTQCPVFVGADRVAAGRLLLRIHPQCNVILSDDGLQHYRLQRDIEIALINSTDAFGNGQLLPAGPLREKKTRLQYVDAIVDSGVDELNQVKMPPIFNMQLLGSYFHRISGSEQQQASFFEGENLVAIAGVGKPARFFRQLSALGLVFEQHAFPDHHAYSAHELARFRDKTLLMTEKDAVKCSAFDNGNAWFLPVEAKLTSQTNQSLVALILQKLRN